MLRFPDRRPKGQSAAVKTCIKDTHGFPGRSHQEYRFFGLHSQRLNLGMNDMSALEGVTHTNYCTTQCYVASEVDVTRDGQVVQFKNLGNGLEAFLELRDLRKI
jgi:hypothetical protein